MSTNETRPVFTYDHYEPGKVYGEKSFRVDEAVMRKWRAVYPRDDDECVMPGGMLAMVILDAVLAFNSPRPPGGVHGGQTFEVRRMPRVGDELITEVCCEDKEIRKTRRIVRVGTTTRNAATCEVMFAGTMTIIVAV